MADRQGFVRKRMIAALALVAAAAGWATYSATSLEQQAQQQLVERTVSNVFSNMHADAAMDDVYSDEDGDLIADTPAKSALLAEPTALVFSFIASEDTANNAEVWQAATDAIADQTDLPVTYLHLEDSKEQLAALRGGQLHVTAFSSGTVPVAVNTAGFVPLCTIGTAADDDNARGAFGYKMQFIVKADSPLKKLDDLRGKKIAFVRPRSNSGCKAAMIHLWEKHGMQPERDFDWYYSYSHNTSIAEVLDGSADAAPIASDILDRMVTKGEVDKDAYRVIYESERFPPVAFGCAYTLPLELRESILAALMGLDWTDTKLADEMGAGVTKTFLPISYKDDWANIRRVDQAAVSVRNSVAGQ